MFGRTPLLSRRQMKVCPGVLNGHRGLAGSAADAEDTLSEAEGCQLSASLHRGQKSLWPCAEAARFSGFIWRKLARAYNINTNNVENGGYERRRGAPPWPVARPPARTVPPALRFPRPPSHTAIGFHCGAASCGNESSPWRRAWETVLLSTRGEAA
ncbi:hypothetical protein SKAU_G00187420 [Synaphobranchus kaupii]|uniref:Uncharacterized protein n=1 Tax=Synaphobranchus kaupii TaxID=118154 RepID=A0A9Q1FDD7_SYNKA|nr:hypothetical protein SKAU_G00187420 [Synaphobranchus kaupii]